MAPEPLPPQVPGGTGPRPEDGPQDVSQDPGSISIEATVPPAAKKMIEVARSQLGYHEAADGHTKYGQWYADRHHDPGFENANWCDMGLSWCAWKAAAGSVVGEYAYTPWHAQWFDDQGRWGTRPHVGDLVFYDWEGGHSISGIDHIGLVEELRSDGRIVTIEFNTSDAVMRRVRTPAGIVVGYGSPDYKSLEDDMAEVVSLGAGEKQNVPASNDISIKFRKEYSDSHGHHSPDGYSIIVGSSVWAVCDAIVQLTGLKANDPVDVAWSRMKAPAKDGDPWTLLDDAWRTPFRAAPDGTIRAQLGGQLGLDKDTRMRLRVYNPNAYPVTVASALAKVAFLKY
ncbi:CHAP domain-containing protein [Actinoallomurus purpureus]|uniref:CHAP domain-containing protein n=1 Tax=Actinoallomurus purpureus TaxID=478114 RepID=UPI0020927EE6|nr:CHAP domain-containing protein [Actinoallomurus purpureus]MCO6004974.1 CHAP domain-containing protein [Actinoallomurus purpureus]